MNDADKKLLELAEVTAKRFRNRYVEDISEIKLRDDALVVLYAVPRLIAEKEAMLKRIENLQRAIMSRAKHGCTGPCEHGSCITEGVCDECHLDRDTWCDPCWLSEALAADDAIVKESSR